MKKPEFYTKPPQKEISTRTLVNTTQIQDGTDISEIVKSNPSNSLEFEWKYNRHEEQDEYFLVEYAITVTKNEKYESELLKYKTDKQKYEDDLVEYNKYCEQLRIKREETEKELRRKKYEELRKEFEPN